MAAKGAILLYDTLGTKFDGAVKSAFKKIIPRTNPYSPVNVLCGQLLIKCQQDDQQALNYQLLCDPNVFLYCDKYTVAPLGPEEFQLLEAIKSHTDRLEAFRHKLDFGISLQQGHSVYVTIPGENLSVEPLARATVHYKGKIGNLPGVNFGVEIMV